LSDDPTREFPQESFQARVLAEFAAIRGELGGIRTDIATLNARQERFEDRLTTLEEKADSRLKETRPIWESVQLAIERLEMKFDKVIRELYELHSDIGLHEKRLTRLETR